MFKELRKSDVIYFNDTPEASEIYHNLGLKRIENVDSKLEKIF